MEHGIRLLSSTAPRAAIEALGEDPTRIEGPAPIRLFTTDQGFRVACYAVPIAEVPADFFADPDGQWTFEGLAEAAGFSPREGVAIGALKEPFNGHPDGAAVVTLNAEARPHIAIIECPIAFACTREEDEAARVSAA